MAGSASSGHPDSFPLLPKERAHEAFHREAVTALVSETHWFGSRFQMVLLILLGTSAMFCHHFLYSYLDGTQVDADYILDPRIPVTKQVLVGAAGNAIATVGSFALGAAIGIAFVQVLWLRLGQRSHSILQIRTIMELRMSPYAPNAWHAWGVGQSLRILAVLGTAMTLITIFAPSSLRTVYVPYLTNSKPCIVSQVDLSGDGYNKRFHFGSEAQQTTSQGLRKMVARNMLGGAYLTPTNPCNRSCSFTLTFNAPVMNCTDDTSQYDFSDMVRKSDPDQKQIVIWNSTHDINGNGSLIWLATMGGADASTGKAFACDVYNGTYSVDVTHNGTVATVEILDVKVGQRLGDSDRSAPEYNALQFTSLTLGQMLCGSVNINVEAMIQVTLEEDENNVLVLYSTFGTPQYNSSSVPWLWNPDLSGVLSELMSNISISLLSNPLSIPMIDVATNCRYPSIIYSYNRPHLALTYGLGLITATVCILAGFYSISTSNREESLHFSRLIVAILNPDLGKVELTGETRLRAVSNTSGTHSQFIVESENGLT